jgi:hypothetical protein
MIFDYNPIAEYQIFARTTSRRESFLDVNRIPAQKAKAY